MGLLIYIFNQCYNSVCYWNYLIDLHSKQIYSLCHFDLFLINLILSFQITVATVTCHSTYSSASQTASASTAGTPDFNDAQTIRLHLNDTQI